MSSVLQSNVPWMFESKDNIWLRLDAVLVTGFELMNIYIKEYFSFTRTCNFI